MSVHADPGMERTVLGAALADPAVVEQVTASLAPGDFSSTQHCTIFAAILRLQGAGSAVDIMTLKAELEREDALEAVGGAEYVAGLVDGMPRVTSIESWARLLREHSRLRALRRGLDQLCERLEEPDANADEVLADVERLGVPDALGGGILDRREVAKRTWRLIDDEVSGRATGISTGLSSLDSRLRFGGFRGGQLVYVGARTSRGKSALLLAFADAAAEAGHRALMFSLEMTPEENGVRRLLQETGVGMRSVCSWRKDERERALDQLSSAAHVLQRPLDFASPTVRTLAGIRAECQRAKAQGALGLVVVDYLGLVRYGSARNGRSLYERTTAISQGLKALAMDLEVPVLCAVQLNREPAGQGPRRLPTLAHFRDSGAIEQDCDVALLIHQASSSGAIEDGSVELLIAKQRNGWTGKVGFHWNGTCARFEEAGAEETL